MKEAKETKINGCSMFIVRDGEKTFSAYDKHTGKKIAEFFKNSLDEYPLMRLMRRPRLIFSAVYRPVEKEVELEYRLIGIKKNKIYSPRVMDEMKEIENVFFGVDSILNFFLMKERAINLIKSL